MTLRSDAWIERDGDALTLILAAPIAVGVVLYLAMTTNDLELAGAVGLLMVAAPFALVFLRDRIAARLGSGKAWATLIAFPQIGLAVAAIVWAMLLSWLPASMVASLLMTATVGLLVAAPRRTA